MPARPYIVLATLAVALLPGAAFGGDWTVVRLRGGVFTLENGQWQPLKRGDRVSDARLIQTAGNGRVTFQQGAQVLDLGPDTQVQIIDFAGDTKTTVWQHQGVVDVTAEARNTEHFSVQTPYLAAVVKGTTFRVTSDRGASTVDVTSGRVSVHDHASGHSVGVWAGQSAMAGSGEVLKVEGGGHKEPVMTADGEILPSRAADRRSDKDAPFSSGLGSGDGHTSYGGGGGSGPTGGADNPGGGGGGTDAGGGGSPGEGNGSGPDGGGGGGAGDGDGNADGGGAGDGGGGTDGGGAGDGGGGTGPDGTDEDNDGGGGTDGGGAGGGGTGTGGGGGAGGGPGDDTGGTGEDDGGTGEDDGGTGEDDEDEDDGDDDDDDDSDEDDDEDDEDDDEDDEDDD